MAFLGSSILASDSGSPFFSEVKTVTTPGVKQTLLTYTVQVNEQLALSQIYLTCRQSGFFELKSDGDLIASGRTGPSSLNVNFSFFPFRNIDSGKVLVLEFTQGTGGPATDIEAYLQASLI